MIFFRTVNKHTTLLILAILLLSFGQLSASEKGSRIDSLLSRAIEIQYENLDIAIDNFLTCLEYYEEVADTAKIIQTRMLLVGKYSGMGKYQLSYDYASIDQNGMVAAKRVGETNIIGTHLATGLKDTCLVYVKGVEKNSLFTIISLSGKIVSHSQQLPLNLQALDQGVYILRIKSNEKVFHKRFIRKN